MSTTQSQPFDKVIKILERYCDCLEKQLENKKALIGGEAQNQDQTKQVS